MQKSSRDLFEEYSKEAIQTARTAVAAIVLLNSAALLALLSKLDVLISSGAAASASKVLLYWALGAAVGVSVWFPVYLNASYGAKNRADPDDQRVRTVICATIVSGLALAIAAVGLFICGIVALSGGLADLPVR